VEEAVLAAQQAAGVPKHLQAGTLREAVSDLASRIELTPELKEFYKVVDNLPTKPDPMMSPKLRALVEANAVRVEADKAHEAAISQGGNNVPNSRMALEKAENKVASVYEGLGASGELGAIKKELAMREQTKQAVAGLETKVSHNADDNQQPPQAQQVEDKRTAEQKSAAQARA
jgi:hypothetical protein